MAQIASALEPGREVAGARTALEELKAQYGADLPACFAYMAHRPAALRAFSDFVFAVMAGDAVPYQHKELAYLKASTAVECELCEENHSRYAVRAGWSEEQVAAVRCFEDSPLFGEQEKAILRYADHCARQPGPCPVALVADLKRFFDDAQVVELTLVIAVAVSFGRFQNALGIRDADGP